MSRSAALLLCLLGGHVWKAATKTLPVRPPGHKVLPHDSKARGLFVTSGGLKKLQEIKAEPGSLLQENINSINNCYPEEIVRYYSPGYSDTFLQRVDSYQPLTN